MSEAEMWDSPTTKSRFRIVERAPERLTIEFEIDPNDIGPPEHLHPAQEQEFSVIEGQLLLRAGGRDVLLKPGESFLVPPGTAHTFHNAGEYRVRFTSQHRPPLGFERFLKTIYDLDRDGHGDAKGQPNFAHTMVILRAHPNEQFLAGPPLFAQRILIAIVGTIGRLFGYAPEYTSRRPRHLYITQTGSPTLDDAPDDDYLHRSR